MTETHPQEVAELVERLDRALAMDAQTATDREWSDLLAVALDCREALTNAAPPVEASERLRLLIAELEALTPDELAYVRLAEPAKQLLAALQQSRSTPGAAELRIGDKVEVIGRYEADYRGQDWWVAGIRVHDSGEGLDVTIAEQWPIPNRHWREYRGQTDGFRPEELRVIANEGATPAPVAGNALEAGKVAVPRELLSEFADAAESLDDKHRDSSDIWEASAAMSITAGTIRKLAALHGQSAGKPVGVE